MRLHNRLPIAVTSTVVAALLLLRSLPASWLRLLPPCPIHQAFGILCPGCGATRALLALLHGDLASAWHFNPLLLLLAPFLVAYTVRAIRRGTAPRVPVPLTAAFLLLAFSFTLARNL